ncbi:MAG: PKD domain-containing protein [Bacteroidetes bacterium]|nr:PKD domain-containing protein [Bacteroidota bacterium]HET6243134.1 PKD domain-containing protein [Bacteroidia bacterium]
MNHNKENNGFEDFIKDSFENYEVEYNPGHWTEMSQKLENSPIGKSSKTNWFGSSGIKLGGVSLLLITSFICYYLYDLGSPIIAQENGIGNHVIPETPAKDKNVIIAEKAIISDSENISGIINSIPDKHQEQIQNNLSVIKSETIAFQQILNQVSTENETEIKDNVKSIKNNSGTLYNSNFTIERLSKCDLLSKFTLDNPNDSYSYEWNFGDGMSSKNINPIHQYRNPGSFMVVLNVYDKENNKISGSKKQFNIDPINTPDANFDWKTFNSGSVNHGAEFSGNCNNTTEWIWSFGDNQFSYEKTPKHIYLSRGNYQVKLIAKNPDGCKDSIAKTIVFEENNPLLAPNVFSPDGDGLNDNFIPKALEISEFSFEMLIYDRSGSLVYKTKDASKPWDGRSFKSGDEFHTGTTFLWVVNINQNDGEIKSYFGNITIIRR